MPLFQSKGRHWLLLPMALMGFAIGGCPADEGQVSGPHRISVAATPATGEVNGPAIVVAVNVLKPDGSPLESGNTVDIIEFACVDSGTDSVGLFEDQDAGDCAQTVRTVTGSNGAVSANFRCTGAGEATILAIPTGINDPNDPPGSVTINCVPGPTGQWSVTTISRVEGFLETGSNEVTIEATAVQDDGSTPVPAGTKMKVSVEGDSLTTSGSSLILADEDGKATFTMVTNEQEGESIVLVSFDDGRFGSGASQSFRVRPPSDVRATVLEVTVRKDNLVVLGNDRTVLADDEDQLTIEAELIAPAGAEFDVSGQPVDFNITSGVGGFGLGATEQEQVVTDEANKAQVVFSGGITPGTTVIEISVVDPNPDNADEVILTESVTINVNSLGFIEFVSIEPAVMFVRGSGDNELSDVTFRLLDTNRNPLAGLEVEMALPSSTLAGVSLTSALPLSDANGFAKTTVISGTTTGTVNVTATARIGATVLSAASGSIPIVGRTPSRNAFTVRCDFKNMAGLVGVDPGNIETFISEPIACAGTLLDRFSNPVGEASSLTFLVEGGQPPGTTQSVPWDTGVTDTPPANTGTYAFTYNPLGNIPCDVDPDFDSDEPYLFFDEDECSAIQQNCPDREEPDCSRNPRDGLVSIVASTNGEEAFSDLNSNGTYDEGEPFWDIGEPFVDVNDNNEFDLGELFRDFESGEDPPNGEYDGPNGVWDNNLTIWTTTHVLLTGLPEVQESEIDGEPLLSSGFVFDVADREEPIRGVHEVNGGLVTLGSLWQDKNLNVLNRSNSYDVTVLGDTSGVTVTPITSESPDLGLGFRLIYGDQLEEDVRSTYRTRVRDLDSPPFAFIADVEYAFAEGETEKLVRLEFTAEVNVVPGGGDSFIITRVVSVLFQNQQ